MPGSDRRVLVFGDVIDDVVVVPRMPVQTDTDTPSSIALRPGGSAANTAAWLAGSGVPTRFVGRCAAADSRRHAEALRATGVDAVLIADDEQPTGTIVVIVEGEHRTMLTERGANAGLSPADIDPAGFALIHATGYSIPLHPGALGRLIQRVHDAGARLSLNAGSVATIREIGAERFREEIAGTDILIANAAEAALLTSESDPVRAAGILGADHPLVVVTVGAAGAVIAPGDLAPGDLAAGNTVRRVPPVAATAVDPTGAGDAFTAGLLAGILRHGDPVRAAEEGTRLAARAVSRVGGRPT